MKTIALDTREHTPDGNTQIGAFNEPLIVSPVVEIQIGTVESILGVVAVLFAIGVAWGQLRKSVAHVEATIERFDQRVVPKLQDVRERVAAIEGKLNTLWAPAERKPPRSRARKPTRAATAR